MAVFNFLIFICAAIAALMAYQVLTNKFADKTVEARIKAEKERQKKLREANSTSILKKISMVMDKLLPLNRTDSDEYRQKLSRAGLKLEPSVWRSIVLLCIIAGIIAGFLFIMPNSNIPLGFRIIGVTLCGVFGYGLSFLYLNGKIKDRKKEIEMSLPNALELLSVTVSAGSPPEAGFRQVAINTQGPISEEFRMVDNEINLLGMSRAVALKRMSDRCQSSMVSTFCSALIQADQQGTSIVRVLQSQAKIARDVLDSEIAEKVHKLPTQMSIPLALCFLPAIIGIILFPIVVELLSFFAGQDFSGLSF